MLRRNPHNSLCIPCCDRVGSQSTRPVCPPRNLSHVQKNEREDQQPHPCNGGTPQRGRLHERRKLVRDIIHPAAVGSAAAQEERSPAMEASERPPREICLRVEGVDVPELSSPVSLNYAPLSSPPPHDTITRHIIYKKNVAKFQVSERCREALASIEKWPNKEPGS